MRYLRVGAALCGALGMSGCLATMEDTDLLHRQLNAMNATLEQMSKNQADMNQRFERMGKSYDAQSETLKDFDSRLSRNSAKLDDLSVMFDTAMAETKSKAAAVLPSQIYGEAYANLMRRSYDSAVQGFSLYLEKFPGGELGDSCYYYLGNAYEGKDDRKNAAVAYARVLAKYPGSEFTAAARLKYAQALLALGGKDEEAKNYLRFVIKDFPYSQQAAIARAELEKLEPGSAADRTGPAAQVKPAAPPSPSLPAKKAAQPESGKRGRKNGASGSK
ncbi:MAG: tetratricopeptide repeat protein [Elusimicrobiaceae bacterium]|nr:tetratricopeptide repeat protein [Elusimicrobiaceae bacterium]